MLTNVDIHKCDMEDKEVLNLSNANTSAWRPLMLLPCGRITDVYNVLIMPVVLAFIRFVYTIFPADELNNCRVTTELNVDKSDAYPTTLEILDIC